MSSQVYLSSGLSFLLFESCLDYSCFFFFFFLFFRPLYYAMELLQQNVILRHELLLPNGAGILDPLSGSIAV